MIKVLIPVRSGSVRVRNKNIKPFAGSNLLSIKIEQMKRIEGIDGIIVNSNSDEMLDIAKSLGAETVKRDEYFATSTVSMNEVYQNMAENCNCDTIIFADATNPLIKDETINNCIKSYFSNIEKYDSLATVNEVKQFMWLDNKPLNYDANKKPKSQDLPDIVALNHAICIIPRDLMISKKDIIGYNPNLYKIDSVEATDIDNSTDFEFAEFMYNKYRLGA
jgi:CMP-N-acetylneuraminic acid synthetase